VVVLTGGYDRIFCAGANIRMLAQASHAFKVNFCKFTNETRCGIEEACAAGQTWVAALNGTASGGGYELAMACEEIYLIDDGNAAVSLPEVPLLGVLPGTGGLTRLTDKRKVRRDMADVFCTKAEGFRTRDAVKYRFVDGGFPKSRWVAGINARVQALANRPAPVSAGVKLPALEYQIRDDSFSYRYVEVKLDLEERVAQLVVKGPDSAPEATPNTWALRAFRELEDALLRLRFNTLSIGVVVLKTEGDPKAVLAHDAALEAGFDGSTEGRWLAGEIRAWQSRVLRRLDNMAKSLFAVVEPGNCFAGVLLEIVLASDRSFMLTDDGGLNRLFTNAANGGWHRMSSGLTRLQARYPGQPDLPGKVLETGDIDAETAADLELVTYSPDEIDWHDEVRIAIEERASLSPDALTGMEQNLRFGGPESMDNKIYGRLTAWQNWIFQRPNAVGERGALKLFGAPERPVFDYRRT
jgi:benzoyl-CoA-dihydrodiol lyase